MTLHRTDFRRTPVQAGCSMDRRRHCPARSAIGRPLNHQRSPWTRVAHNWPHQRSTRSSLPPLDRTTRRVYALRALAVDSRADQDLSTDVMGTCVLPPSILSIGSEYGRCTQQTSQPTTPGPWNRGSMRALKSAPRPVAPLSGVLPHSRTSNTSALSTGAPVNTANLTPTTPPNPSAS